MPVRPRSPETRDPEIYAIASNPTAFIPPYSPPPTVECVWCGELLSAETWLVHQVDTHFDECYANWVRGLALLKARERYGALRKAAKARYGGLQVRT